MMPPCKFLLAANTRGVEEGLGGRNPSEKSGAPLNKDARAYCHPRFSLPASPAEHFAPGPHPAPLLRKVSGQHILAVGIMRQLRGHCLGAGQWLTEPPSLSVMRHKSVTAGKMRRRLAQLI
jgi:hypothetical protein